MKKMMKKPYIVLVLILILAVIYTQYLGDEPATEADAYIADAQAEISDYADDGDANDYDYDDDDDDGNHSWGNPHTLPDHFERHGGDFDAENAQDYAKQAHAFYLDRENHQVKTDDDGVARVYDANTNTFGAYNSDGTTRTFYKPSAGQAYFDRQPGN